MRGALVSRKWKPRGWRTIWVSRVCWADELAVDLPEEGARGNGVHTALNTYTRYYGPSSVPAVCCLGNASMVD